MGHLSVAGASFVFALAGCAHVSTRIEGDWRLATTENFRVYAQGEHAEKTARRLELLRRALTREFPPRGKMTPVDVLVLPSLDDLEAAVGENKAGITHFSEDGLGIVISVEGLDANGKVATVVPHELAHYVSHYSIRHLPRWTSEGLAQVYETVLIGENGGVAIGKIPPWTLQYLRRLLLQTDWGVEHRGHTLDWLWRWSEHEPTEETTSIAYLLSGAWLHLLLNQHPEQTQKFFAALNRSEPPRAAFAEAFSAVSPDRLERELISYLVGDPPTSYREVLSLAIAPPAVRAANRPELHVLRAKLFERGGRPDLRELELALQLDPYQREARWLALDESERSIEKGRALVATDDSDEAWARFAGILVWFPKRDVELRRTAVERAAHLTGSPRAQVVAAVGRSLDGDWASAREHIEQALALAPWSVRAHYVAAKVYSATGDCVAANAEKADVLAFISHDASPPPELRSALAAMVCPGEGRKPLRPKEELSPLLEK